MTKKSGLADSPFFANPPSTRIEAISEVNTRTPERTPERANVRTPERRNTRTGERKIIRHSFNIYQDQLEALKRLVARKTLQSETASLSDLVRDALDTFLNKQS